jgi:hypothetical protein
MPWFIFRSATSRGALVHYHKLFSCFYHCVRVQYVRSTFRYRTVYSSRTELTLRLFLLLLDVCSPSLFIVHEYWRNSTSYIASCHPLKDSYSPDPFHQRTVLRQTNYSFSLPLRDKEVANNFTISCPSIKCI